MKRGKRRILILLILVVLLLIIFVSMLILKLTKKPTTQVASTTEEDKKIIQEVKDYYKDVEGEIVPDNYNFLVRMYEGSVSSDELYRRIYMLIYVAIPDIYDDLGDNPTEKEIKQYYEKNQENILLYIGVENAQEYKEFVEYILKGDYKEYKNAVFDVKDFVDDGEYTTVGLQIDFSGQTLDLKTSIINNFSEDKPSIKFLPQE